MSSSQRQHLQRHAQQVAARVRELAAKAYWAQFPRAPEFVILFIPGRSVPGGGTRGAAAAHRTGARRQRGAGHPLDPHGRAQVRGVLLAPGPGGRATRARSRSSAAELHARLATFLAHLAKVGQRLGGAVEAFNAAAGSLERQVVPQARRLRDLGATADGAAGGARAAGCHAQGPAVNPPAGRHATLFRVAVQRARTAGACSRRCSASKRKINAALQPGLEHSVAHVRMTWWAEEAQRLRAGHALHPLTRALLAQRPAAAGARRRTFPGWWISPPGIWPARPLRAGGSWRGTASAGRARSPTGRRLRRRTGPAAAPASSSVMIGSVALVRTGDAASALQAAARRRAAARAAG